MRGCFLPVGPGEDLLQEPSLYEVLQCSIVASPNEIKQQFRRLALQHHPDKAGSPERFQAIREAFEVLKDPERRFNYDKTILHCLDMQEYLNRFSELVLTAQGLSLPPHISYLHHPQPAAFVAPLLLQPATPPRQPRRCSGQQLQHPHRPWSPAQGPQLLTRC